MSDEWDESSDEEPKRAAAAAPSAKKPVVVPSRFAGEDEEERGPASDWEESTSEDDAPKPAPSAAAPPKKKGTLKAKLAAKAAAATAEGGGSGGSGDDVYDEDAVLDPRAKARADRERELRSDLDNAASLLGTAGPPRGEAPEALLAMNPKTKDEFEEFSRAIIDLVIKKHEEKPLYATFLEMHVRALAAPLRDVDVRKAASALTTLANEKQKEQRDKAGGKKKGANKPAKPALGGAKSVARVDTGAYEEALDDFGQDDFM